MEDPRSIPIPSNASPKKSRSKTSSTMSGDKPKRPKYSEMISAAVKALRQPTGASRQAITKYVQSNYDVPPTSSKSITTNLKSMLENKKLVLARGVGAAGRYRLNKAGAGAKTTKRTLKRVKKSPKKKRATKSKGKKPKKNIKKRTAKKGPKKSMKKSPKKTLKKKKVVKKKPTKK